MRKERDVREPSKASLREIPEIDFRFARTRPNPYAAVLAAQDVVQFRVGRPSKGTETGPTEPRSVRFSSNIWKLLEARARAEGMPLHAALRAAILEWAAKGQ
ncbi:MAG: hypothetical protein WB493_05880 [Anaeromyxobacteraceae bacterium]